MARRSRILSFGSAAVLVVASVMCAILVDGLTGQVLTIALMTVGLGGALLLVFLEVGLSEEHERAKEEEGRREGTRRHVAAGRPPWARRWPRRPR